MLDLLRPTTSPSSLCSLLSCIHLTLQNLATLQLRCGRAPLALRFLKEAEALGHELSAAEAAATQLSLCALLSQLGRHKEAELHAAEAVSLGEADILEPLATASVSTDVSVKSIEIHENPHYTTYPLHTHYIKIYKESFFEDDFLSKLAFSVFPSGSEMSNRLRLSSLDAGTLSEKACRSLS